MPRCNFTAVRNYVRAVHCETMGHRQGSQMWMRYPTIFRVQGFFYARHPSTHWQALWEVGADGIIARGCACARSAGGLGPSASGQCRRRLCAGPGVTVT